MGGGPDITYPQQPTYGEGMADAMKAQMEQLLGQGDFANIYADAGFEGGNLADIIREVDTSSPTDRTDRYGCSASDIIGYTPGVNQRYLR